MFDTVEVELGGRKHLVTRAEIMTWWRQIELQAEDRRSVAGAREQSQKLKKRLAQSLRNIPGVDGVTIEYIGREIEV